ncbi:MAG: tRNA (adenosine(37)-N6)-threonylcarbamoyltransferase complex dimerization subunit type 1 TsaB [Candidatus Thiodiazotropha sp.]
MKLIAIETASETCSAALFDDGDIYLRYELKPRGHSELILQMMDEVLAQAQTSLTDLDAVAFGRGPGSFTGVRIAAGVIQGVAFAADLPVVPVSTLAALAQRAYREKGEPGLLAAFDARMGELYWAGYRIGDDGLVVPVIDEQVASAEQVEIPGEGEWYGVGSGWGAYARQLEQRLGTTLLGYKSDIHCSARDVALLAADYFQQGAAVAPELALPVYLRNRVAEKA